MTNDLTLLQQISELNAQGALALATGKAGKSSVAVLRQAMVNMDQLCAAGPLDTDSTSESLFPFQTIPVEGLRNDNFYVFNHAFLVNTESLAMSEDVSNADLSFCCAILTFNMALTYHQLGQLSGDSRKLRAACRLYGNCVEMASSVQGLPTPSAGDNLFLIQMMATNNASQIQYSLANFDESFYLLSNVRNMMHLIFQLPSESQAISLLPAEALDEINLNAVVCGYPTAAPTA